MGRTNVLICSFPNLSEFFLETHNDTFEMEDLDVDAVRASNQIAAIEHPGQWTSLGMLCGDVRVIYALGLSCRIHTLDLELVTPDTLPLLLVLLNDFQPQIFLGAFLCEGLTSLLLEDALGALFNILAPTCHSLQFSLSIRDAALELSTLPVCMTRLFSLA